MVGGFKYHEPLWKSPLEVPDGGYSSVEHNTTCKIYLQHSPGIAASHSCHNSNPGQGEEHSSTRCLTRGNGSSNGLALTEMTSHSLDDTYGDHWSAYDKD